jgi:hypothetical protein
MTRPGGGDHPGYVDGTEAMALAGALYRAGESTSRMAEVTGLGHATIVRLVMGEAPRLQPRTAQAALKLREMLPQQETA